MNMNKGKGVHKARGGVYSLYRQSLSEEVDRVEMNAIQRAPQQSVAIRVRVREMHIQECKEFDKHTTLYVALHCIV